MAFPFYHILPSLTCAYVTVSKVVWFGENACTDGDYMSNSTK